MNNQSSSLTNGFKYPIQRNSAPGPGGGDELSIRGFLLILQRRKAMIFYSVAVCFVLGVVVCILMKPIYKTVGEIEIQKSATDGLGLDNLTNPLQQEQPDALDASITLQTQASILESKGLALKVIKDLNLEHTEDFVQKFSPVSWALNVLSPSSVTDPPGSSLENAPHRRDHALKVFKANLKITAKAGTRLIDIQYKSSDPKIAAAVVNDLTKSLVDYGLSSRIAATSQVSGWLTNQLGDIKKEAETQQGRLEQLQRESGIYSLGIPDAQGKEIAYSATLDRLQQATQELSAATSNRIMKGALYKSVENGDPELISGLAGSSLATTSAAVNNSFQLIQTLRGQQAAMSSQVAGDSSKYGTAYPKLVDEKAGLDAINNEIKSEVKRIGQRVENDYKAAQVVEEKTRTVYNEERKAADNMNDKAIALLIARQEATDARSLYQTLYSHLKEAGVIEGLRSSNISVVDSGQVPSKPLPYVPLGLAGSVFFGIFTGVILSLIAEATSDRVEGMAMIENTLNAPILAILPTTVSKNLDGGIGALSAKLSRTPSGGEKGTGTRRLAVLDGPNTAYVEALRGLRTSLVLPRSFNDPKTILITSAAEKEGKSTLSMNLAALLELNGSRVLLIDADLRSAGLSSYMGLERRSFGLIEHHKSGLSDALSEAVEPEIFTPFPELPKLSALSAGAVVRYPAELLSSERMEMLVKTWSENYDYVVIDSPPVLAVTDALILARLVDTTLLVTRHGQSTQKSLERAYRTLHDIEGRSVGVVVNDVSRNSVSFSDFYGYRGTIYYSEV